ncbi:xanthine dehydrogenase accessory protein XdhC [Phaeovulum sp.]|uniref:xanthine dehydrogenase accessory protein XdhC n=1 Tax=Phaeovulum sp. TaxID=2934796 RepID=UPI0039E5A138
MSLDVGMLTRMAARGPFVRVLVAETRGSTPREAGAAMLVWGEGIEGTIGGGTLEWEAMARAREVLATGRARLERIALGPAMGQCCGGAVTLAYERFDAASVPDPGQALHIRRIEGPEAMPLAVSRALARARAAGVVPPLLVSGWVLEQSLIATTPVWIWGAGHVGRAIVSVLAPLPGLRLSWVDTGDDRFPVTPEGVTRLCAENPADLVSVTPPGARHFVLTYSHALDLELCHRLLQHGFGALGLIGSASKAARFRSRLRGLGHSDAQILRIICPIGDPNLGKHPQAIAVGIAATLLRETSATRAAKAQTISKGCAG